MNPLKAESCKVTPHNIFPETYTAREPKAVSITISYAIAITPTLLFYFIIFQDCGIDKYSKAQFTSPPIWWTASRFGL
ncbi:MAG TPA: hypothetical protein VII93_14820 [Anaerolineales bacterium]